jgi:hypothetical protein
VSFRALLVLLMMTDRYVHLPENVTVTYDHDYTLDPKDGDVYMVIHNPRTTVTPDLAYIHLTNLFNGNPALGECPHSAHRHTQPFGISRGNCSSYQQYNLCLFQCEPLLYITDISTGNCDITISFNMHRVNLEKFGKDNHIYNK